MKLLDQSPLSSALSDLPRELSCHGTSLPVLLFRTDPRNGYHNTHHDLFPLAFALPSYPLPADLSFLAGVTPFPRHSGPLGNLSLAYLLSPASRSASPLFPPLHPVLRSPLWQGVPRNILPLSHFVKLKFYFF